MSDDFHANLESYYLQLEQVNAALTTDPGNDELLKLKTDLQEVIDLTKELLVQQSGSSSSFGFEDWKVGEKCLSLWSNDGKYYEAIIEEILPDGKVSVRIPELSVGENTHVTLLKKLHNKPFELNRAGGGGSSKASAGPSGSTAKRVATKESFAERKQALLKQKEYLKKRKQKKQARVQELEAEREKVKKKWINFSTKKGLLNKKKSIFASPETVDGRVGIGTCGVAGKGMTGFSQADKWRKGWTK